jgi:hypothetical protein
MGTHKGKQFRKAAGGRSWAGAEDAKRRLDDQLAGRGSSRIPRGWLLSEAIDFFKAHKQAQGIKHRVLTVYAREPATSALVFCGVLGNLKCDLYWVKARLTVTN